VAKCRPAEIVHHALFQFSAFPPKEGLHSGEALTHPSVVSHAGRRSLVQSDDLLRRPPAMLSNLACRRKYQTCSICNEAVQLATAKTDESGKPVHEECYLQKVRLNATVRGSTSTQSDPKHKEKAVVQELIDLFDFATRLPVSRFCPHCGSELESRAVTFLYHERTWNIHLTNCVTCTPR
jgi:hypothetical protein